MFTLMKSTRLIAGLLCIFCAKADSLGFSASASSTTATEIAVQNKIIKKLTPQFFGFNLEIPPFQASLWDKNAHQVPPAIVEYLRRFPGAVYRYPGGTVANHFDWAAAIGSEAIRPARQIVDWQPAGVVQFGPAEYLNFVQQVNGTAWYVLNLYGEYSHESSPAQVANSAKQLTAFMKTQQASGLPGVYRWELGNELDRGKYRWPASKYIAVSKEVISAVQQADNKAQFVGMAQDWQHTGVSIFGVDYNNAVARGLQANVKEFAGHLYYDGEPWGPPVARVLKQFEKNTKAIQAGASNATMWVTEHARTPLGTPEDPGWNKNWTQSANLDATISVADMMINLARTPKVQGTFIHALHGSSGPWPMFHKQKEGGYRPSAVFWGLILLRETFLGNVLEGSVNVSSNEGQNSKKGINALVQTNDAKTRFSVWLVNRGDEQVSGQFSMMQLAGKKILVKSASLSGKENRDGNYTTPFQVFPVREQLKISVNANGKFTLPIPGHSLFTAGIEVLP